MRFDKLILKCIDNIQRKIADDIFAFILFVEFGFFIEFEAKTAIQKFDNDIIDVGIVLTIISADRIIHLFLAVL